MYFLETIEGTKGEKFTSALLKYMFINSEGFRRAFRDRIKSHFAASQLLSFKNGVICETEVAAENNKGFIDLVLYADNTVIGIENKLWAAMQDEQPQKYRSKLESLAKKHCGNVSAFKFMMVAPHERQEEIRKELNKQGILSGERIILDWQDVMDDLNTLAQSESGEVQCVAIAFHEYLDNQIQDINLNTSRDRLLGKDVHLPNSFHEDFLYKLKNRGVFRHSGRMAGSGGEGSRKWYGFAFDVNEVRSSAPIWPWFGFAAVETGVILVVQNLPSNFEAPSDSFKVVAQPDERYTWLEVVFDEKDNTVQKWSAKLEPLFERLRLSAPQATTETPGG